MKAAHQECAAVAEDYMKFGILALMQSPTGKPFKQVYDESIAEFVLADELGFDCIWLTEHHFSPDHHKELGGEYGICCSPLALGAYVAAVTKRIRIGQAINVVPLMDPIRLAEDAAVLDIVSNGRLNFGVGLGYRNYQFQGFRVPEEEKGERFEESLEIIKKAWTGENFTFDGVHYKIPETRVVPTPLQQPRPPIWVALTRFWKDEAIEYAARNGYHVILAWASPEQLRSGRALYERLLKEHGHDIPVHFPVGRHLFVAETDEEAYRIAEPAVQYYYRHTSGTRPVQDHEREGWLFGSPETVIRKIRDHEDQGVNYFLLWTAFGTLEHSRVVESMKLFAEEVMPAFEEAPVKV